MFTVEQEFDSTIVTVLDEKGTVEDLQMIADDNWVYLRQFNEERDQYEVLKIKYEMMKDLITSLTKGEGMYK